MRRAAGPRPRSRGPGETSAGLPGVSRGRPPARCRVEQDTRTSRGFFASILLIRALDWPARDRGEDIFTAIFFSIFTASVGEDEIARVHFD